MDNLFYQPLIDEGVYHLDADESRHCAKVLRKKSGDVIFITNGKGNWYEARLTEASPTACRFEILSTKTENPKDYHIHIAIAPTKNPDRIEWFVEKALEIGVDEISFVLCDKSERAAMKLERIQKLAISGMKQSLKSTLARINSMVLFPEFIKSAKASELYIAYVDTSNPVILSKIAKPNTSYVVLIGPEGDFSKKEIDFALAHHYKKISLGPHRLRTETAGLAACHTLNLINF